MTSTHTAPAPLKRVVGLKRLTLYGVGTMIGAGFYALLGEISATAGMHTPLSFLIAGLLALLAGISFAELSSRYPVSAGESEYIFKGTKSRRLAQTTGWLVSLTGIVSAATLSVATAQFTRDLIDVSNTLVIILVVLALTAIASIGIGLSSSTVVVIAIIEIGTLIAAISWAVATADPAESTRSLMTLPDMTGAAAILSATFIAFYAFIGFEDMVNIAEETIDPETTLPRAILIAVSVTTLVYVIASAIAVVTAGPAALAEANTPLAVLVATIDWAPTAVVYVSILAGLNGAIVQIVMASRVMYGMAVSGRAFKQLGIVNRHTNTPLTSTLLAGAVILILALSAPLATLATGTSFIVLAVFFLVNYSLMRVHKNADGRPHHGFRAPAWIPWAGMIATGLLLAWQIVDTLLPV